MRWHPWPPIWEYPYRSTRRNGVSRNGTCTAAAAFAGAVGSMAGILAAGGGEGEAGAVGTREGEGEERGGLACKAGRRPPELDWSTWQAHGGSTTAGMEHRGRRDSEKSTQV
jgi:hypothetical protein